MKRKLFYVISIALVMQFSTHSYAKSVNDLKKQQDNVKNMTQTTESNLEETKQEKNEALLRMEALDVDLNQAVEELDFINKQLDDTNFLLQLATMARDQAENAKEAQYEALVSRIRYMYINGNIGYLDTVLKASSFTDFLNRVEYMNRIAKYDQDILTLYENTENEIKSNVTIINKQKLEALILQEEQEKKTEWLDRLLAQKSEQVEKLSQDEILYEQQLRDWENTSNEIEKMIKKAQEEERKAREAAEAAAKAAAQSAPATQAYTGGKLRAPLDSYVMTSPYGNRPSPFTGKTEFHTGMDMAAGYGSNVYAAEAGKVLFAGWQRGYGNVLIIEHGSGLSTLYAHNSSLIAKEGQSVKRGELIAKVGSTGQSTGNHVHFEVRLYGAHTNPAPYLQ